MQQKKATEWEWMWEGGGVWGGGERSLQKR